MLVQLLIDRYVDVKEIKGLILRNAAAGRTQFRHKVQTFQMVPNRPHFHTVEQIARKPACWLTFLFVSGLYRSVAKWFLRNIMIAIFGWRMCDPYAWSVTIYHA